MRAIHLLFEDGHQSVYQEPQVRALLDQGAVSPQAHFWQEGMAEWRPLSEWIPSPTIAPPRRDRHGDAALRRETRRNRAVMPPLRPAQPGSGRQKYYLRKSLGLLSALLLVLLTACLAAAWLNLHLDFRHAFGPTPLEPGDVTNYFRHKIWLFVAYLVVLAAMLVPYCFWVHHAHLNCRGLANTTRFTSDRAVAYYFIPFVNLVRPHQVMQETWKVSDRPPASHIRKDSILVSFWWILSLVLLVMNPLVWLHFRDLHDPALVQRQITFYFALDVISVLQLLALMAIVILIGLHQARLTRIRE